MPAGDRRSMKRRRRLAAIAFLWVVAATLAQAPSAQAAACTKVAAPWGSNRAAGTAANPYRTVEKLMESVGFSQTGCLRNGTYFEDVKIIRGGLPFLPVGLRNYPGEAARVVGRLWVAAGANNVIVSGLYLDGLNAADLPSPNISSRGVQLIGNDVSNRRTTICFALGSYSFGEADGVLIERNRIHDCGVRPPTNHHHGVYLDVSSDVEIRQNWIYDNADRGIQLYPDAQRTLVTQNVIDRNGEGIIFGGNGGVTSSDNLVEHNVITNSTARWNVESYYPPGTPPGQRNTVRQNCLAGGARDPATGGIQSPPVGFVAYANLVADPHFRNAANKDYRLSADSPCLAVYPDGAYIPGPGIPAPPLPVSSRSQLRGSVSLRVRPRKVSGARRLRLSGRARGIGAVQGQQVRIQLRRGGVWRTVARASLRRHGKFSVKWRFRPGRRTRAIRLRARVRAVGSSQSVRVQVRRRGRSRSFVAGGPVG